MPDEQEELEPAGVARSIIAHVYVWGNGHVTAYDQDGRHLASYQGALADVRARIIADAPAEAAFHFTSYGLQARDITRAQFAEWPV